MDLVRPLGLGGIRCAVVARPGDAICYSRFTTTVLPWADPWNEPGRLLEILLCFGASQPERPVLYYEGDWDLLLVSRERERLRRVFRFVIPDADLVEDLVDKARFLALAERLGLPTPRARLLAAGDTAANDVDLRFPVIAKPLIRQWETWRPLAGDAKALEVRTAEDLRRLAARLGAAGIDVLAQELIPGPETSVESYHVYVDERGEVAGEFSGRKLRTHPAAYGYSTALVITDRPDVHALGRELVRRMNFRGLAKFDFKRTPDGALHLLEVNPRFTLWHHPGAVAGVNLPAIVYRDMLGLPRGPATRARPGVRWCYHQYAMEQGIPLRRWVPWALRCEAKSVIALDDPMPTVGGALARVSRRMRRSVGSGRPWARHALRSAG
jgi:predicted ATP-grasp superfamily ATP-dependent carboligase